MQTLPSPPDHLSVRRKWMFRCGAAVLGLLPIVVAELLFVGMNWGNPDDHHDPFVGFGEIRPLFVLDESGEFFRTAPSRRLFFRPDGFRAVRKPRSRRIFCLGGSTVQGRPFRIETSFTNWLRINLETIEPDRETEVINCGGISYASYRLIPILEECLTHQPDLIVVCTGHNEFLEERSYSQFKEGSDLNRRWHERLISLRSLNLARTALESLWPQSEPEDSDCRTILKTEVDALLDYRGGLAAYHWDANWRAGVVNHYEQNLRRICRLCRAAGVPLILVLPPSNLADCPPFKSEHSETLSEDELNRWNKTLDDARNLSRSAAGRAVERYRELTRIDPQYAMTWYELGQICLARHDYEEARNCFTRARDLDVCPLRILSSMEAALRRVAEDYGVALLDAHDLLESRTPLGILGDFLLVDHIHPSIRGHQQIADRLVRLMADAGFVSPGEFWKAKATAAQQQYFESLDELYFLRGLRTRDALRAWTQGRADGPDLEDDRSMNGQP